MSASPTNTPMMRQYWEYRHKLPADVILLFRVGDFYEMFDSDAEIGARALGITLTQRAGSALAGIPYQAVNSYVPRLLAAGHRVAICEQMENAVPGKLVRRALSRILSPGTTLEDAHMDARRNNYLLALAGHKRGLLCIAWLDLSTAEFRIASGTHTTILPILAALDPREVLIPDDEAASWQKNTGMDAFLDTHLVTKLPSWQFEPNSGERSIAAALGVLNLQGFGIEVGNPALGTAGAVLTYATDSLCQKPQNLYQISEYKPAGALIIDHASQRNLELFRGNGGSRNGSLLDAIDNTVTAAGARLLEQWLATPPGNVAVALARQTCVGDLVRHAGVCARVQEKLRSVRDIVRILSRLQNRIRNPRELGGIRDTLRQLPEIHAELAASALAGTSINALATNIGLCPKLRELLDSALSNEVPGDIAAGGVIRKGYDAELDRLRALSTDSKSWVAALERAEQARTGIKNLKIIYNGAFGYLIEITKSNLHLAPENYIRRQTLTNAERYITEELKQKEKEILRADEFALTRETEIFQGLVERIQEHSASLQNTAQALAELDVYCGWATLARDWDYCRPEVDNSGVLEIEQGRHPVVEQMLRKEGGTQAFVPNDTRLQSNGEQVALLTGPNMAGKSTYIRQVALIVLMAQLGSWVPARNAHVGIVDRLFCRVGASDELARGNSTFMVEMNETANILNNATASSLVILDEIGRGTSTYDGISIAWSVAEFLHGNGECGPRTLFATHYHELTRLQSILPRMRNYCVAVKEWNDEIIFVRQVIPGAADRSYGIHVARLAGLPDCVVARANAILADMENGSSTFMQSRANAFIHWENLPTLTPTSEPVLPPPPSPILADPSTSTAGPPLIIPLRAAPPAAPVEDGQLELF
ncbi:MAG: DNA mismatch repair protein MutS [Puniceicoccales bacterium]|jgi:DNA mismatch repair protein MutS|nr:DNA mismatch repair protein MutS [Puniceicoccales bacterium]